MATGVNVKMGVSGITQFKQNIKAAQTSVKTLDQALQLNEKQFKATGDAEAYMQQKSELLKVRLEEQKAVIKNAESALKQMTQQGVDKASAAFQSMQQQLLKAKGELIDTETELENIGTAGKEAGDGVDSMNQQLKRIGDGVNFEAINTRIDGITTKLGNAARKAGQIVRNLTQSVLGAGSWADDLATRSAAYSRAGYELKPEDLYRMEQTARIIDTDADTIINAQSRLRKAMGAESNQDTMGAFAALGIDPTDRHGDWESVFWEAGEALMSLTDPIEQDEYAMKLFGRSWGELIPLFSEGRDAWEEMNASWSWIGDDALENLQQMDDQSQRLTSEWENFQRQLEAAFAPVLTQGMEILTRLFEQLNEYLSSEKGQQMLESLGTAVSGLFEDLKGIDPEEVVKGFAGIFEKIIGGFQWLYEHKSDVVTALKGIVLGWGALKLTGGALKILQLLNAIKGFGFLGGGTAAAAGAAAGGSWASAFASAAMKAAPFLAFLYTLLNPAASSDEIGNNDLLDKEGNLTAEAEYYGYTKDENGDVIGQMGHWDQNERERTSDDDRATWNSMRVTPKGPGEYDALIASGRRYDMNWLPLVTEFGRSGWFDPGSIPALISSIQRMADVSEYQPALERIAQNSLTPSDLSGFRGLPAEIAQAVQSGMANVRIYIDGYQAGRVLTPYVGGAMGGLVTKQKQ